MVAAVNRAGNGAADDDPAVGLDENTRGGRARLAGNGERLAAIAVEAVVEVAARREPTNGDAHLIVKRVVVPLLADDDDRPIPRVRLRGAAVIDGDRIAFFGIAEAHEA